MKYTITCLGILISGLIFLSITLNAQNVVWAKNIGGTSSDISYAVAVDVLGNVYTTGFFEGVADFDPGSDTFNLTSAVYGDIFISKLNASGNFVWARQISGYNTEIAYSIAIDFLGNIITTGYFEGTVDFDPGLGTYNLTSAGSQDIFISKLDSSGNFVWANQIGGTYSDKGWATAVDATGNVFISGIFSSSVDFDPGVGTFPLISVGNVDIFITKFDASGNFIWAKSMGEINSEYGYGIDVDALGNVYTSGYFEGTVDFDPGAGTYQLTSVGGEDVYISKLDASGDFIWAKQMGGINNIDIAFSIVVDFSGNIYTTGYFRNTADFDPGPGTFYLTSAGGSDIFISKLNSSGNFIWAKSIGGSSSLIEQGTSIALDATGNIYTTGNFFGTVDFNPGAGTYYLSAASGNQDIFISKLDTFGNFIWAKRIGGTLVEKSNSIALDATGNIYITGNFAGLVDFDPGPGTLLLNSAAIGVYNIFIQKLNQKGVFGNIYLDLNQNCIHENDEIGLCGRRAVINPGNIIVETDSSGFWHIDSLAVGNFTIQADTSGFWEKTCLLVQNFTVNNSEIITQASGFGFVSTELCSNPDVSIHMPFQRRCFSSQNIYVQVCNKNIATAPINNAYIEVELDSLITPSSASMSYSSLGNNLYRFNVGTLNPGICVDFWISATVSCDAVLGQTLCMKAKLFPSDTCVFDTIPATEPPDFIPCTLPWDKSSISIEGWCQNDSIYFLITNTSDLGNGDMDCFSPVRLYIDGQYIWLDSIRLAGGVSDTLVFVGDGRTWRLEVDQHPLHPGNSHPNTTVELCGNVDNWTPDLVNILPQDDSDPEVDIYCGEVAGSYDPNDKQGFPTGIMSTHFISPNQEIEYMIRFQNTGTDTAFTVVIRDTLDSDLDIYSVSSGVSSHNYSFNMYGPRVLEWTFNNILLPDSAIDNDGSNGFVTFTVHQNNNLADYTEIKNSCGIYFDYNDPVITNTTSHVVKRSIKTSSSTSQISVIADSCDEYSYNGFIYKKTGVYWQIQGDTLVTLNLTINNNSTDIDVIAACDFYTWIDGNTYTANNNTATYTLTNVVGCDSIVILNLTINDIDNTVIQNGNTLTSNQDVALYQWLDCDNSNSPVLGETNQSFTATANGNYAVEISYNGCTVMSSCIPITTVSIDDFISDKNVVFYQNPLTGTFYVDLGSNFRNGYINVKNTLGQEITRVEKIINKITELNIKGAIGIYFLEIGSTMHEKKVFKIVKQ